MGICKPATQFDHVHIVVIYQFPRYSYCLFFLFEINGDSIERCCICFNNVEFFFFITRKRIDIGKLHNNTSINKLTTQHLKHYTFHIPLFSNDPWNISDQCKLIIRKLRGVRTANCRRKHLIN